PARRTSFLRRDGVLRSATFSDVHCAADCPRWCTGEEFFPRLRQARAFDDPESGNARRNCLRGSRDFDSRSVRLTGPQERSEDLTRSAFVSRSQSVRRLSETQTRTSQTLVDRFKMDDFRRQTLSFI